MDETESGLADKKPEILKVVEEIRAKEDFTPEEALDLAGRFLQLQSDYELHHQDSIENIGEGILHEAAETWKDARMEKEAALFKAESGDYTGIKALLRKYSTKGGLGMHSGIYNYPHISIFNKRFSRMAEVLPDHGRPYLPPPPPSVKR